MIVIKKKEMKKIFLDVNNNTMNVMTEQEKNRKIIKIYEVIIAWKYNVKIWRKRSCMIWDVLDWIWNNRPEAMIITEWLKCSEWLITLLPLRRHKGSPIDDQLDECINFIYPMTE